MRITLNVASRNEYVPEVERYISTIKERPGLGWAI